jgi:hypothetical protein
MAHERAGLPLKENQIALRDEHNSETELARPTRDVGRWFDEPRTLSDARHELDEELMPLRPCAMARCGVDMASVADIDQLASPCRGKLLRPCE